MLTLTKIVNSNLLKASSSQLMTSVRGVRGIKPLFRSSPPRYRKNLAYLPPLDAYLNSKEENVGLESGVKLRQEKLSAYKEYLPDNSNTNLIEALFHQDNDVDRLLRIIDQNLDTMSSFYIAVSFEALDDMMRANICDISTIAVSPEFSQLCMKTMLKMRFFETDEILKLLRCLSTLHVPGDTLLVQAALQMTRHLINDFTLIELNALSEALDTFETNQDMGKSLLPAIKQAIPLVQERLIADNQYISLGDVKKPVKINDDITS